MPRISSYTDAYRIEIAGIDQGSYDSHQVLITINPGDGGIDRKVNLGGGTVTLGESEILVNLSVVFYENGKTTDRPWPENGTYTWR